ncbi:MAG: APC family permease, partial [Terriglobia bacterium]
VLVLRFTEPGPREFRVPLNLRFKRVELPVGLALITATLFATAVINLFTKQIATISGVAFTVVFYLIFTISEKYSHHVGGAATALDQFNLEPGETLTAETLGVRPANALVLVRDYNTLYNLAAVLKRVNPYKQDVVVLHIRVLSRGGSGEHDLVPDQLFTFKERELFTRALNLAEKNGKTIHLAVVPATDVWDGTMRAAQSLQSATVVLGLSPKMAAPEEARLAGQAWERLQNPKPQLTLEICSPTGQANISYLGPHSPHLSPKEIDLLHGIWLDFSDELAPEEVHHHDIVHFALDELCRTMASGKRDEIKARLKKHLEDIQAHRDPQI